ncbi:hypothetical protein [Bdellovibrio sp. HCB209]|uniref:hypothetical protein n=1 Tax=Bdellovibrio sp. HCB209 TaxID=3394354 RepID=UPI0039B5F1F6
MKIAVIGFVSAVAFLGVLSFFMFRYLQNEGIGYEQKVPSFVSLEEGFQACLSGDATKCDEVFSEETKKFLQDPQFVAHMKEQSESLGRRVSSQIIPSSYKRVSSVGLRFPSRNGTVTTIAFTVQYANDPAAKVTLATGEEDGKLIIGNYFIESKVFK